MRRKSRSEYVLWERRLPQRNESLLDHLDQGPTESVHGRCLRTRTRPTSKIQRSIISSILGWIPWMFFSWFLVGNWKIMQIIYRMNSNNILLNKKCSEIHPNYDFKILANSELNWEKNRNSCFGWISGYFRSTEKPTESSLHIIILILDFIVRMDFWIHYFWALKTVLYRSQNWHFTNCWFGVFILIVKYSIQYKHSMFPK